jgi:hypothetical protein
MAMRHLITVLPVCLKKQVFFLCDLEYNHGVVKNVTVC